MFSGVSRPIVNDERGARAGSSPHSRHTGWSSRFPVVARGVGFPPPLRPILVHEAHPHHSRVVIAAPGDDEWMLGLQGKDVGGELQSHLRRFSHPTIASETIPMLPTATQKPRGSWIRGMRLKFIP